MKYSGIILLLVLASCSLFETREPELPNTNKTSFKPPYSADVVISNFINSINEKNADNYLACFSDSSQGDARFFSFVASQEGQSSYPGLFLDWSLNEEKRHFNYLLNSISTDSFPSLVLSNTSKYDLMMTDSAILTSDYLFEPKHSKESAVRSVKGTLQFAIYRRSSGWWTIQRWTDEKKDNDSLSTTWSTLKGVFY